MADSDLRKDFEEAGLLKEPEKPVSEILLMAIEKGPKKAFSKFGGMKNPLVQKLVENGVFDLKKNKICLDSFDIVGISLAIGVGLGYFQRVLTTEEPAKGEKKK